MDSDPSRLPIFESVDAESIWLNAQRRQQWVQAEAERVEQRRFRERWANSVLDWVKCDRGNAGVGL